MKWTRSKSSSFAEEPYRISGNQSSKPVEEICLSVESTKSDKVRAIRTEVYSRIVGYYRPVTSWNKGKRREFQDREMLSMGSALDSGEESGE